MDKRIEELAKNLVNYSCDLKKGEKILISNTGFESLPLVRAIIKEVYKVGGLPFVEIINPTIQRELLLDITQEQVDIISEVDAKKMEYMDAYIGIRCLPNPSELSDVSGDRMDIYSKGYRKVTNIRLKSKWVILEYPTYSMAQAAKTSLEEFEDFFYKVCNLDYKKMSEAMTGLVELMEKTDKVHIKGEGTDITFSIKGIDVVKCDGHINIPDGEVFTAPVKDSVNGYITYNTPSEYRGFTFENVRLEFENGKIVKATANNTEKLNEILNSDEGSRYIGEFAIGLNPYVTKPMNKILFDEKIRGSFHFTPGNSYEEANNGNKSNVHWDLVVIQTEEYGGGEIYFDDVLVRKDGIFVLDELKCLNPENLMQ